MNILHKVCPPFPWHSFINKSQFPTQFLFSSRRLAVSAATVIPAKDPLSPSFSPFSSNRPPPATSFSSTSRQANSRAPKLYTRLISMRRIMRVSSKGKHMQYDAWVLVGDQHGSAGWAHGRSLQSSKAVQTATRKAQHSMKFYNLFENRTLHHDIHLTFNRSQIRLLSKPQGINLFAK